MNQPSTLVKIAKGILIAFGVVATLGLMAIYTLFEQACGYHSPFACPPVKAAWLWLSIGVILLLSAAARIYRTEGTGHAPPLLGRLFGKLDRLMDHHAGLQLTWRGGVWLRYELYWERIK